MISLGLLQGCATWPPSMPGATDRHMVFYTQALNAEPKSRESMWNGLRGDQPGVDTDLHRALLQSVAGHSGYNPAAAAKNLEALLATRPPADIAIVAKARLAELRQDSSCQMEARDLRERLNQLVKIEKNLKDKNGN